MIIGKGLVAKSFQNMFSDSKDILLFASGVSNSGLRNPSEFVRERELLMESINLKKFLIYFSTCSIYDPQLRTSPYVQHKIRQENIITNSCTESGFAIFRLPQLVGVTSNPHTLTNFLYKSIDSESAFDVWKYAKRNLIDTENMALIVFYMINSGNKEFHNNVTNIASPHSVTILHIVNIFENILNKKANVRIIDKGSEYTIDARTTIEVAEKLGLNFDSNYADRILRKYYARK